MTKKYELSWSNNKHDFVKVDTHSEYHTPEEQRVCVRCGLDRDHAWHKAQESLREEWEQRESGSIKRYFGSLSDVAQWLEERSNEAEERTHPMDKLRTQKDRAIARATMDAYRSAVIAILEIVREDDEGNPLSMTRVPTIDDIPPIPERTHVHALGIGCLLCDEKEASRRLKEKSDG